MGVGSPYLRTLDLHRYGLRWRWPEIDCAHPLDSGGAGLLWRMRFRGPEPPWPREAFANRVAELHTASSFWLQWGPPAATVILFWIALGQVGLVLWGRRLFRRMVAVSPQR